MRNTLRHDDFFQKARWVVDTHILGLGGVGSELGRLLLKYGVGTASLIHLYDGDIVESHNLPNQAYSDAGEDYIGMHKVDAFARHAKQWGGHDICQNIRTHPTYVRSRIPLSGFAFLCLDNMESRRDICQTSLWENEDVALVFESRMDATLSIVYCLDPNNPTHRKNWERAWFPSSQAQNTVGCGGHIAIPSTVTLTACIMADLFIRAARIEQQDLPTRLPNKVALDLATYELHSEYW